LFSFITFNQFFSLFLFLDHVERGTKHHYEQLCVGILSTFQLSEFGYTVRPMPSLAKVDLAAVFFNRQKLLEEKIFFGKKK
jgi:hypothetical protein